MQAYMLVCFALGIATAFLHHCFYQFLDGRSAERSMFLGLQKYPGVNDQSIVNFLGNVITQMAAGFLVGAISIAYSQVFWWKLRTRHTTLKRVDEFQDFSSRPWNPLTWPAAYSLPLVAVLALCQALMGQVSSITPGAITVTSSLLKGTCYVDNVNLTNADFGGEFDSKHEGSDANGRTRSFTTRVIVTGAVLAPQSRCGTCSYELDFIAPAVQCSNITQASLAEIDSVHPHGPLALPAHEKWIRVWAGEYNWPNLTQMRISSRNMAGASPQTLLPVEQLPVLALNCTAWPATYHVMVNHSAPVPVVATNITVHRQLLSRPTADDFPLAVPAGNVTEHDAHQLLSLWSAFSYLLTGHVDYNKAANIPDSQFSNMAISWSPMVEGSSASGITWSWTGDLQTLIPELMTNVSLSLLSGELSDARNASLTPAWAPCTREGVVFLYSPLRLTVTYAVAVSVTSLCIACGFYASKLNGRGESLYFSRILGATSPPFIPESAIRVTDDGEVVARSRGAKL